MHNGKELSEAWCVWEIEVRGVSVRMEGLLDRGQLMKVLHVRMEYGLFPEDLGGHKGDLVCSSCHNKCHGLGF